MTGRQANQDGDTHQLEQLIEGYRRAFERFKLASERDDRSTDETFFPLFETLNWAASAEDVLRRRGDDTNDSVLKALKYVRNRVHHQWADAIHVRQYEIQARGPGPLMFAGRTFDWFWKPVDELPPPDRGHERGAEEYGDLLAGKPASDALFVVGAWLTMKGW